MQARINLLEGATMLIRPRELIENHPTKFGDGGVLGRRRQHPSQILLIKGERAIFDDHRERRHELGDEECFHEGLGLPRRGGERGTEQSLRKRRFWYAA